MRKSKLVILIFILFLISPIVISIWTIPNRSTYVWNDNQNELIKNKTETPKLSNSNNWILDGLKICTDSSDQSQPQIISDGQGGAIMTWYDFRRGYVDIYAQKVDSDGNVQWLIDGLPICTYNSNAYRPQICSDGIGGAIITWYDDRNGHVYIYAQLIDSSGNIQWTPNGTILCTANSYQQEPQICSDGAGGAIVIWEDRRIGSYYDIYAQRINSSGNLQWNVNGTAICTASYSQFSPQICIDGAGGAIITWHDRRSGSNYDIYTQRINSSGDVQWIGNGTAICTASYDQFYPQICIDGAGGAIITWTDLRSGGTYDIFAQRIDSFGIIQWTSDGVAICTASSYQEEPQISSDGAGGAIISWTDRRSGSQYDLYSQKINSFGIIQWTSDGVAICTASNNQASAQLCSDGAGGAIITWSDNRYGETADIFAQKIDSNGAVQLEVNGLAICTANSYQRGPQICGHGEGNAIITWYDERNGNWDIYASRIFNYTGDTEITIITPESELYTEPMSSFYPATYGFESDEIGDDPDDWFLDETGGTVQIISSHLGHSNVIELHETSDDFTKVYNDIGSKASGTAEWWTSVNRDDDWFELGIYSGDSNDGIHMSFANDGYLKYHDGSVWTVIMSYSADVWYHFKIEWHTATDWHLWINRTSQDGGTGYSYRNSPLNLDQIRFQISDVGGHQDQYMYADAIGYSWDSNYNLGDNWDEGLYLCFELNNSLFAMGYTLDNQANVSISGNATIPLPRDGLHGIRVYGTTLFRLFKQSGINHFIVDTKLPEIQIHAPIQSDTAGEKPPFLMVSIIEANLVSKWYTIGDSETTYDLLGLFGLIDANAWSAVPLGPITIRVYVEDIAGNIVFKQVTITKELEIPVPIIFNIAIVSMFAVIGVLMVLVFREINIPRER